MKNSFKWGLVAVVVLATVGAAVYFGKPGTQKGALTPPFLTTQNGCPGKWSKILETTYEFNGQLNNAGPSLSGATVRDYRNVALAAQQGCDIKVRFESLPQGSGALEPSFLCDVTETMGNIISNDFYITCKSGTPIAGGSFISPNFLYDVVAFNTNNGNPLLYKDRIEIDQFGSQPYIRSSRSFFIPSPIEPIGKSKVTVFVR